MRNLKADLELCKKAEEDFEIIGLNPRGVTNLYAGLGFDAINGWPHAIERAIEAEALVRELVDILNVMFSDAPMSLWLEAKNRLEDLHNKAKEVLGDG